MCLGGGFQLLTDRFSMLQSDVNVFLAFSSSFTFRASAHFPGLSWVGSPGPVGRLQRVFEQAVSLPRRQQDLVARFVATLVEQQKAS
jgi:hypothetical protein